MGQCPSCGASARGKFCSECGSGLVARPCGSCDASVPPGARFCTACGAATASGASAPHQTPAGAPAGGLGRPLWPVLGAAALLFAAVFVVLAFTDRRAPNPAAVPAAGSQSDGGMPDLSQMTPREQFDRLFNRVMTAAEQGDTGTVASFGPMALQAYRNLDAVDADARYHAAMLRLHMGDVPGAGALADTILVDQPAHLFGFVLRAAIARFNGDQDALARNQAAFLSAWEVEMQAGRQEYADHGTMLSNFKESAQAGR